jgi:hypothetical protein
MRNVSSAPCEGKDAKSRERASERQEWIDDLLASDLDDALKVLGVRLARYRNDRTGQCNPAVATLAKGTNKSERTAQRQLRALRERGWIAFPDNRGGKGKSTQYTLTKPRHSYVTVSAPPKGDIQSTKGCHPEPQRVTQLCHPNLRTIEPKKDEVFEFQEGSKEADFRGNKNEVFERSRSPETEPSISEEQKREMKNRFDELVATLKSRSSSR